MAITSLSRRAGGRHSSATSKAISAVKAASCNPIERLELRRLLSTISVNLDSQGSFGGGNTNNLMVYDDTNNNGVYDGGEGYAYSTETSPPDDTLSNCSLGIADDSTVHHLRVVLPSTQFQWTVPSFMADGTEPTLVNIGIGQIGGVSGRVFDDTNGTGSYETGEPLESGWTVYVDANNNGSFDSGEGSTTTDSGGNYSINAETNQRVRVELPSGAWSGGVYIATGYNTTTADLAVHGPITISGSAWNDANDNSSDDSGESAISGDSTWSVYDDVNQNGKLDSGEPSSTIASDGTYSLTADGNLTCHHIRLDLPSNWRVSYPTTGINVVPLSACHCGTTWSNVNFGATQMGRPRS